MNASTDHVSRLPGNQTGKLRLTAKKLASLAGSPFETITWSGVDQPISAQRVLNNACLGETLPPAEGVMGDELTTLSDHEKRVAWLYVNPEGWDPVDLMQVDLSTSSSIVMTDGHHRLAAALLREVPLEANIEGGVLSHISKAISELQGEWVKKPETEVFGTGVFPLTATGKNALRVYGHEGRCWVEDIITGECVARYGHQLWTVGLLRGDTNPSSSITGGRQRYQASVRESGVSQTTHLQGFLSKCQTLLGGQCTGIEDFIRELVVPRELKL